MIGELLSMLQQSSSKHHSGQARDIARTVATSGESEPNIDPKERIAIEQLLRVAELRVASITGLDPSGGSPLRVEVTNRLRWADQTLKDYGNLFDAFGESLQRQPEVSPEDTSGHPMEALLANLGRMIGPVMLAVSSGMLVGKLAQHALGGYVLPVPRPAGSPLLIALPNVDRFASEWSLDRDDLRLWVCLHETVYQAVFGIEHVHNRVTKLLLAHASAFDSNPRGLEDVFADFDPAGGPESLASLESALGDQEALLGLLRSPAQEALLPELTAVLAAVVGYVDHTMDRIGSELIGSYPQLTEALRRHRIETSSSDRFVEQMLGLHLDRKQYNRGAAFAEGVVERAGEEGLQRLFEDPANLPTPNEVDAAGLWLARIDLPRSK